ncbi:unnamed protein product [Urochloa humidicola]
MATPRKPATLRRPFTRSLSPPLRPTPSTALPPAGTGHRGGCCLAEVVRCPDLQVCAAQICRIQARLSPLLGRRPDDDPWEDAANPKNVPVLFKL